MLSYFAYFLIASLTNCQYGLVDLCEVMTTSLAQQDAYVDQPGKLGEPTFNPALAATVRLDAETAEIRRVEGLIVVPDAKTPRDASDRFLSLSLHYGLRNDRTVFLNLVRQTESLTGTQILYQAYYGKTDFKGGLPILGNTVS